MRDKGVAFLILIGLLIIYFGSQYTPAGDLGDAIQEHHETISKLIQDSTN